MTDGTGQIVARRREPLVLYWARIGIWFGLAPLSAAAAIALLVAAVRLFLSVV